MPSESVQRKLERVRPPRVNISYDVETGGAIELKELPFVMGVLGDFTGQPAEPLAQLKDRKFVEVNPGQFRRRARQHEAASGIHRRKQAERRSRGRQARRRPELRELDDFSPDQVARQVKPLEGTAGFAHQARRSARQPARQRQAG